MRFSVDLPYTHIIARGIWQIAEVELYSWEKDFRIDCHSHGYPNPRVTWKRNGIEIVDSLNSSVNTRVYQQRYERDITVIDSYLYFKEVYCHDAGNYSCESSVEGYDYVDIRYIKLICKS